MSSRRYKDNQETEIYNFRVVPDPQISKKLEVLMIYMFFWTTSRSLGDPVVVDILDHLHSPRPRPS